MTSLVEANCQPINGLDIVYHVMVSGPKTSKHFMIGCGLVVYNRTQKVELEQLWIQYTKPLSKEWDPKIRELWQRVCPDEVARVDRNEGFCARDGTRRIIDWINRVVDEHGDNDRDAVRFVCDKNLMGSRWLSCYLERADHEPLEFFFNSPSRVCVNEPVCTSSYEMGLTAASTEMLNRIRRNRTTYSTDAQFVRDMLGIPYSLETDEYDPIASCVHVAERYYSKQALADSFHINIARRLYTLECTTVPIGRMFQALTGDKWSLDGLKQYEWRGYTGNESA